MNKTDFEKKMTEAAREALKELVEDYRDRLLMSAAESASRLTGEVREISVHDLLRGMQHPSTGTRARRSMIDRILGIYTLAGVLIGFGSLAWFAFYDIASGLSAERQLPLMVGIAGFGVALVSFAFARLQYPRVSGGPIGPGLYPRAESASEALGLFISKWQQLEIELRSVAGNLLGESLASGPLSAIIARLRSEKALDETDVIVLTKLLGTRNEVVHRGVEVPAAQMRIYLKEADRLQEKLRSL